MNYEQLKEHINSEIEKLKPEMLALNDCIWENPEISGQEYETSKRLVAKLEEHGYATEYPFAGQETAFRGIYGPNNHKRKIALLAEYDALPEIGHACGHCAIATMALFTAFVTKDLQDELDADIHVIGTPAEETYGGKCLMAQKDVFRAYDFAILVHLSNDDDVTVDASALDSNIFEFYGQAAHAAAGPWEGKNALNAARLLFDACDMMRQHVTPDTRLHGIIKSGGAAPNIVPDYVRVDYYTRAAHRQYLNTITDKVVRMAELAAEMCDCTVKRSIPDNSYDNVRRNLTVEAVLKEAFEATGRTPNKERGPFGSTDLGNVTFQCPAFHPVVRISDSAIHSTAFANDVIAESGHRGIIDGVKIMGYTITKIFTDQKLFDEMKKEFEDQ